MTVRSGDDGRSPWSPRRLAAAEPYTVFTSAFLLSEAVFLPLMMVGQWCLAGAWADGVGARPRRRAWAWASGMGLASGAAVLVRPSWALFVPATLAAWIALAGRGRRLDAADWRPSRRSGRCWSWRVVGATPGFTAASSRPPCGPGRASTTA
ncbi:MAG: hypothetical protein WKF75_05515 [Singulisphaera sp.]